MYSLNCKGKILSLASPQVMGILNITPDSFYKGYLEAGTEEIVEMAANMVAQGAAIIDVGGQSTRPGSSIISASEESDRVLPVLEKLSKNFPAIIFSIDTFYAAVAREACAAGASIINDVSAGSLDKSMIATAGNLGVPYVCMHMRGTPATMQQETNYTDLLAEMLQYFNEKISACRAAGIKDIVLDPGFGFAKNISQNYYLLKNLQTFCALNLPLLAGVSRKGMLYRPLGITADEALNATTAANMLALQNGANILRVHDVKEASQAIKIWELYKSSKG